VRFREVVVPLVVLLSLVVLMAVFPFDGCDKRQDDPSAYTELGVPGPRYQLGWGEDRVPWADLDVEERTEVLERQLAVLDKQLRAPLRPRARALTERLEASRELPADRRLEAVEELRMDVRALSRR